MTGNKNSCFEEQEYLIDNYNCMCMCVGGFKLLMNYLTRFPAGKSST